MQGDTVITMPAVQGGFDLVWGNCGDNGPWRLSVVSLTGSMFVEGSIINNSPWTAIKFWSDDHSAAPCHWVINRDLLEDTQTDITVQAILDLLLPMEGNLAWGVHCHGSGPLLHKEAERRRVLH